MVEELSEANIEHISSQNKNRVIMKRKLNCFANQVIRSEN